MIGRAMLKISGEAFGAGKGQGLDAEAMATIAHEIQTAHEAGTQLCVVVGGGNFIRGAEIGSSAIHRASADYMGMLATVINAVALQEVLEHRGVPVRIQSSVRIDAVAEPFVRRRALGHLAKRRVLILAGGTGKPYVTTDTAAAQAALELECETLFKATKVDGVYTADPHLDPSAVRYEHLTYDQVIAGMDTIRVMDMTAISLCKDHDLPIIVFDLRRTGNIAQALRGNRIGTSISRNAPAGSA